MYCGFSGNIIHRWSSQGYNYRKCPSAWRAIQKYGWQNIKKYIIFSSKDKEEALRKEAKMIQQLDLLNPNNGYNLVPGGGAPPHPKKLNLSAEQRMKKSQSAKAMWQDPEKASFLKQRMREECHKSRMQKTKKERNEIWGTHNLGRTPVNAKKVEQIDLETGTVLAEYTSAGQAAIALGLDKTAAANIRRTARGTGKSAYGYGWRWKND